MRLIGVARLGRDAEVKFTQNQTAVANLSLAFNYGMKDNDGKRPTQWVKASLWGKPAEALADWLVKGQQVFVDCDDVHIETYEGQSGPGHNLVARVTSIELVGGKPEGNGGGQQRSSSPAPAPAPRQSQARAPAPAQSNQGFDDDDSEIPF